MSLLERLMLRVRYRRPRQPSSTPVFDQSARAALFRGTIKLLALPLIPLAALVWFGHPALRTSYSWNGNAHAPVYHRCTYLAFDGFHTFRPHGSSGDCPAVIFIPFTPKL